MKALNFLELKTLVQTLGPALERAQLQEVYCNDKGVVLGFHLRGQTLWLVADMSPNAPVLLLFENTPPWKKTTQQKPVGLFLKSHAVNLYFKEITLLQEWGRVLLITLVGGDKKCEIEVRLIPKQANMIVSCRETEFSKAKSIAWDKPKELQVHSQEMALDVGRSVEEVIKEWRAQYEKGTKTALDPFEFWNKQRLKDIDKKQKALIEIQKQLEQDLPGWWFAIGKSLKENWSFEGLTHEQLQVLDLQQSVQGNMEKAFQKAKQLEQKRQGTLARVEILKKEISQLEKAHFSPKQEKQKISQRDLMKASESKGRKWELASGAVAYIGKTALDNLSLLRAAKAWDYWLHLRDYPGAHAIIRRQKDQKVTDEDISKVATWVAKESITSKESLSQVRLSVVLVECRYVRPIKGDKAGKVTYTHPRVLEVTLP